MTKNCFSSHNPSQSTSNKADKFNKFGANLENVCISFHRRFDCSCQSLFSGRETGYQAISPPKADIFLTFYNFLKYLNLKSFGN